MNHSPEQLDLFEEKDELALIRKELAVLRREQAQWRRTMTAKYHQLSKLCLHLQEENEQLSLRLKTLEKASQQQESRSGDNEDYLAKLFAAAYLS